MTRTTPEWHAFRDAVAGHDFARAEVLLGNAPHIINLKNAIGETVLHWLAVENDFDAVKWLAGHGADLNSRNEFGTPLLFEVALLGYTDLFRWFIVNGVDSERKDAEGQSLSDYLLEHGKKDIADTANAIITEQSARGDGIPPPQP